MLKRLTWLEKLSHVSSGSTVAKSCALGEPLRYGRLVAVNQLKNENGGRGRDRTTAGHLESVTYRFYKGREAQDIQDIQAVSTN